MRTRSFVTALALLLSPLALAPLAQAQNSTPTRGCLEPFQVTFNVEWRGMGAGTSTLKLTRQSDTEYTYESRNVARGIFRLAFPEAITQVSHFTVVDGKIRPSSYVADDGTDSTNRDISLQFDWNAGRVTGIAEDAPVSQPLEPGVQDGLSVQIALLCALAGGDTPKSFQLIDKDEVKEYRYTAEGKATLSTPLGELQTVIYTSQRADSSRLTRLWIAPGLGYLPVQAEQVRKGKREIRLTLRSVTRQ